MEALAPQVVEQPLHVIQLATNAMKPVPWTLSVFGDRWVFESEGHPPATIAREHLAKWVDLDMIAMVNGVRVTIEGKKLLFPLKSDARAQLLAWLGPPTQQDLVRALDQRYSIANVVMAVVMVLVATPWFMPAWLAPTDADPTAFTFDWVLLIWGGTTLIGWGVAKLAPHRAVFLFDIAANLAVAAWWAYGVASGQRSPWLALMIGLMFFGASVSYKHYKRFAALR